MKKIININFSGRVIPIEDSAYESLQRYIDSLRRYFINEEGRDEIINDIESRIAELMFDKIKKGSPAITDADMDSIIQSMGRVEDFERSEAAASANEYTNTTEGATGTNTETNQKRFSGRLYRDSSDKILGGVCSGIANYFHVDPAIVRLLFALLVFGAGTGILIYILLWIILPAKPINATAKHLGKRFFRNPDDKILGGVAGGLAAYFNKEAWMFRLIFAAPLLLNIIFGILNGIFWAFHGNVFPNFFVGSITGTFIITYIILWVVLPEAKTPYDKMEMRGEKVDVNTIKQNVQEGMSDLKNRMQNWGDEVKSSAQQFSEKAKTFANQGKTFASEVGETAKPIGSGLGNAIRIIFKAFFIFIAGSIAFGLFVLLIVLLFGGGLAAGSIKQDLLNFVLNGFWQHTFFWGTVIFFIVVPVVAFVTWIVRRILNIKSKRHYLAYIFGSLWFIGIISLLSLIYSIVSDTIREESVEQQVQITQPINTLHVRVDEPPVRYNGDLWFIDEDEGWDLTADSLKLSEMKVRVFKSDDSSYSVTVHRYSRGRNRPVAYERANKIRYNISTQDSTLILGSGFAIGKQDKFRGQRLTVEIRVPVGKKIVFDESVMEKLNRYDVIRVQESRSDRRYRRDRDFNWEEDRWFQWEPAVEYVMTATGTLVTATEASQTPSIINATEVNRDSIERLIEERNRQNELDRERLKKLEEEKKTSALLQEKKTKIIPASIPFIPIII